MNRRKYLASVGSSLLMAGCIAEDYRVAIGRIAMLNFTQSRVTIDVEITEKESVVYSEKHEIEGDDNPDDVITPSVVVMDALPDRPGNFVIKYGLVGESLNTFNFAESIDTDCGQVDIYVRENEPIELFFSSGCDSIK